jgi:hypothetical protein
MSLALAPLSNRTFLTGVALATTLVVTPSADAQAGRSAARAPSGERSAPPTTGSRGPVRRGAAGDAAGALTDADITLGGVRYSAKVDAMCRVDDRATTGNGRFYYRAMYPWFGQRVADDKPQWRFVLEIERPTRPEAYERFVFSFRDGRRGGSIQTFGRGKTGSGTVRVERRGAGARFVLAGRSDAGEGVQATIECPTFLRSGGEAGG